MIIAIGGVSRAGKSTLANLLKERIENLGQSVVIIEQDKYVNNQKDIPKVRDKTDWESPLSINFKDFNKAIISANTKYDHVIVEGLMVYFEKDFIKNYDKNIFIEIPKTLFINRKKVDLRWGSKREPNWYINHIWDSYRRYGMQNLPGDSIRLKGKKKFDLDRIILKLGVQTEEVKLFNEIADKYQSIYEHVERGAMMSSPGIRYKKKNFAFFQRNEMTFKLGKTFNAKANGINTIRHLSPFKTKAPLRAWYIVGSEQKEIWEDLTLLAFEYIQQEQG